MTKSPIALLAIVGISLMVAACGDTKQDGKRSTAAAARRAGDSIVTKATPELGPTDDDDFPVLDYGHVPDGKDLQDLLALVKRYFAAAAAANGAKACSMLYYAVAESVAEEYGHLPALRGMTCAVTLSKIFEQRHQELVAKNASLKIPLVRVEGGHALLVLHFSTEVESRKIPARFASGAWTIQELLDSSMP